MAEYEIRNDDGGVFDELVAKDVTVHIERMDTKQWWMGIYLKDGTDIRINWYGEVPVIEVDDWNDEEPEL